MRVSASRAARPSSPGADFGQNAQRRRCLWDACDTSSAAAHAFRSILGHMKLAAGISVALIAVVAGIGCATILGDDFKVGPSSSVPGDSGVGGLDGSRDAAAAVGDGAVVPDGAQAARLSCGWVLAAPKPLDIQVGPQTSAGRLFGPLYVHHVPQGPVRVVTQLGQNAFRYYNFKTADPGPPAMFELMQPGSLLNVRRIKGGLGVLFATSAGPQNVLAVFPFLDGDATLAPAPVPLTHPGEVAPNGLGGTFFEQDGDYRFVVAYQNANLHVVGAGHSAEVGLRTLLSGTQSYQVDNSPMAFVAGAPDSVVYFMSGGNQGPSPVRSFSVTADMKATAPMTATAGADVSKSSVSLAVDVGPAGVGRYNVALFTAEFAPLAGAVWVGQVDASKLYGVTTDQLTQAQTYSTSERFAVSGSGHWFGNRLAIAGAGFVGPNFNPAKGLNFLYFDKSGTVLADLSDGTKLLTDQPGVIVRSDLDQTDELNTFDVAWVSEVVDASASKITDTLFYNQLRCHP